MVFIVITFFSKIIFKYFNRIQSKKMMKVDIYNLDPLLKKVCIFWEHFAFIFARTDKTQLKVNNFHVASLKLIVLHKF